MSKCDWPGCANGGLCTSGNVGGAFVCNYHFEITNGKAMDDLSQYEFDVISFMRMKAARRVGPSITSPGGRENNQEGGRDVSDRCELSNEELIKKVRMWVDELCRTGGKAWSLQVPVNMERDPDVLINELCNRFDSVLAPHNTEPVPAGDAELRDAQPGGSTPSQYALPAGAAELQDLIEFREMNFAMGNIFKACYRKKDAVDRLYDIRKIIWFAQREEQRLMKEGKEEKTIDFQAALATAYDAATESIRRLYAVDHHFEGGE